MKLTAKIIALFFVAAALLVAASGYFSIQREVELFHQEMSRRHAELAQAWAVQIRPMLAMAGPEQMQLSAEWLTPQMNNSVRVRWVDRDAETAGEERPYARLAELDELRAGELRSLPVVLPDDSERYCSYYAIGYSTNDRWLLELSEPFTRRDAYTQTTIQNTIYSLVGLGLVAVLTAALVGMRLVGRPLDALVAKTQRAASGDLTQPLLVRGHDELSELAVSLNTMCESLDQSQQNAINEATQRMAMLEQLRHSDRLKTVGRLGAGVAHELGTPLSVVAGRAALIAEGRLENEDIQNSARIIQAETRRMTSLIEGLLNFARRSAPNRTRCRIADVVHKTMPLLDAFVKKKSATVTAQIPNDIKDTCKADFGQLQQVISNLIMNAVLSREDGAAVTVTLENRSARNPETPDCPPEDTVAITVADNGDGISDEIKPHLFEPFFTTRETGEGTGLGLSIVHGIVTEHGGWIQVESQVGVGSRFIVFLPLEN